MSMSTHIAGFREPDEEWQKMKAVWDACTAAGVEIPAEVEEFFGWAVPDPAGVEISLDHKAREWKNSYAEGFEIDVADIPPQIRTIRFYNSW